MNIKRKSIFYLTLIVFYFLYFITSSGINCSNDGGHMGLACTMYEEHQLHIEKYKDKLVRSPDWAVKEGVIYSDRLPGTAFMIMPFLVNAQLVKPIVSNKKYETISFKVMAAMLLPNLCGVLGLYLFFMVGYKHFSFSFWTCYLSMIILGSCTLYYLESTHIFSHILSMLLVSWAFYLALKSKTSAKNWQYILYLISVIIGFSTLIELQNILFFIPIFFYVLIVNQESIFKNILQNVKVGLLCTVIITACVSILIIYNYLAFDEIMLKSNKYNPFFPEEKSFFSSLSGNLFEGLDNLLFSFNNWQSNWNWSLAIGNQTPGVFASSPILLLAMMGYIPFFKSYRKEAVLSIIIQLIALLISSFHVTTFVRHVFTIHLLMSLPLFFLIRWALNLSPVRKIVGLVIIGILSSYSFLKMIYINSNYKGRDNIDAIFPYLENAGYFILLNIPILVLLTVYLIILKNKITPIKKRLSH